MYCEECKHYHLSYEGGGFEHPVYRALCRHNQVYEALNSLGVYRHKGYLPLVVEKVPIPRWCPLPCHKQKPTKTRMIKAILKAYQSRERND